MSRVVVVFGGKSGEHEVSLASARAVISALEKSGRHEVVPVGITRSGRWVSSGDPMLALTRELEAATGETLETIETSGLPQTLGGAEIAASEKAVVFPVMHGPFGEDGKIQGMLEMAGVPYVGSGVLGSSVGMDKITMKKVFAHSGLPQVKWLGFTRRDWIEDRDGVIEKVEATTGFPCWAKPSNLGSSVGISRADDRESLIRAIDEAAEHDRRIIVEEHVDAREIEVSVLGNESPEVSLPGEIVIKDADFYDYEAKYSEGGMELSVPAEIPDSTTDEIRRIAKEAFISVDAGGMARIDFFVDRGTDALYLNEINTIPGFTDTSVYSKLWAASGLAYEELLDRLIELALERYADR